MQAILVETSPRNQTPPMLPEVDIELNKDKEFEHILPGVRRYLWSLVARIDAEGTKTARVNKECRRNLVRRIEEISVVEAAAEAMLFEQEPGQLPGESPLSIVISHDEATHVGDFMRSQDVEVPLPVGETRVALAAELLVLASRYMDHYEDTAVLDPREELVPAAAAA